MVASVSAFAPEALKAFSEVSLSGATKVNVKVKVHRACRTCRTCRTCRICRTVRGVLTAPFSPSVLCCYCCLLLAACAPREL